MTLDRDRRSAYGTVGTEDATRPSEAEEEEGEPMAVANDKTTIHGESFLPSTASLDQYDEDVAQRYKQVPEKNGGTPLSKGTTRSRKENRAMEDPPGYEVEKETGWKKPEAYESEGPGEAGRTAKKKD
ncbi:MAG TPA: hypothetical protein VM582_02495 [Candidatus Thermoplasmatota archaeon]|nr:hypothetical protein [Candidatus Thermoplasmatota archaeon]